MTKLLPLLLLAICGVCLSACTKKVKVVEDSRLPPKLNTATLLKNIDRALYVPKVAEMKGDMRVETGSIGNLSFKATIRTQTDSVFWISLRKLGFEGARARVTNSEVIVLNRLQREVTVASPQEIAKEMGQLPFEPNLSNVLAAFGGQPIGDWRSAKVERLPGRYELTLPANTNAKLEVQAAASTVPVRWSYKNGDEYGEVIFSDFRAAGRGQVFPYKREFTFSDLPGDTSYVALELESLTAHESLEYPISIPKNYERKGL